MSNTRKSIKEKGLTDSKLTDKKSLSIKYEDITDGDAKYKFNFDMKKRTIDNESYAKRYYFIYSDKDHELNLHITKNISSYITPYRQADLITDLYKNIYSLNGVSPKSIFDGFACIGGNATSFSKYFPIVNAVEKNLHTASIFEHNIKQLESKGLILADRINLFKDDIMRLLDKVDGAVFLDPPFANEKGTLFKDAEGKDITLSHLLKLVSNKSDIIIIKLDKKNTKTFYLPGFKTYELVMKGKYEIFDSVKYKDPSYRRIKTGIRDLYKLYVLCSDKFKNIPKFPKELIEYQYDRFSLTFEPIPTVSTSASSIASSSSTSQPKDWGKFKFPSIKGGNENNIILGIIILLILILVMLILSIDVKYIMILSLITLLISGYRLIMNDNLLISMD
jgi:16S rRNA G966 N2-methylase RsmD